MLKLNSKFHLLTTPLFIVLLNTPCVSSASGGTIQFSHPTFNVHENDIPRVAKIEVTREGGSDGKVSVKYSTADDTATAGSDYKEKTGELVWEDGDATAKTFEVKIINDQDFNEGYETVSLTLTEPTGDASLGTQSESTLRIADDDCGTNDPDAPNAHWEDTCPSGSDAFSSEAIVNIAFGASCFFDDASGVYEVKLRGPARAFRKDGTDHSIETEMYDMELKGTTPLGPVVMRAGDGIANRENDGPLYSPGKVTEHPGDSTKADSYFDIFFELETPIGVFHNQTPFTMNATGLLGVPPVKLKHKDGTIYTITYLHPTFTSHIALMLYNTDNQPTACFKVKEIGVPAGRHIPVRRIPTNPDLAVLDSFTALTRDGQVSIAWETVAEENNAAFRVWRGMPLSGICSENPDDYTEVTQVTPLISSKGTKVSGATYTDVIDKNVVRGVTYCYALEDIDHDGKSTFHMDKIVPVTAD